MSAHLIKYQYFIISSPASIKWSIFSQLLITKWSIIDKHHFLRSLAESAIAVIVRNMKLQLRENWHHGEDSNRPMRTVLSCTQRRLTWLQCRMSEQSAQYDKSRQMPVKQIIHYLKACRTLSWKIMMRWDRHHAVIIIAITAAHQKSFT